jgi:hypothetical protein
MDGKRSVIAKGAGLPTIALLSDMDEVLGTTAGHTLEVAEGVDYLTGKASEHRLHEVTLTLELLDPPLLSRGAGRIMLSPCRDRPIEAASSISPAILRPIPPP